MIQVDKEYKNRLFDELGINSIHKKEILVSEKGTTHITEFSSFRSNMVEILLNKCAAADVGNLPNIDFANVVIAAQKVVRSNVEELSENIQQLEIELEKFDKSNFT